MYQITLQLDDRFVNADIPLADKIAFQVKMRKQLQSLLGIETDLALMEHVTLKNMKTSGQQSQEVINILSGLFHNPTPLTAEKEKETDYPDSNEAVVNSPLETAEGSKVAE